MNRSKLYMYRGRLILWPGVMRIIRWWRKAADGINWKILFYLKTILIWRAAYKLLKGDTYTTGLKKATEEQNVDTGGLWHTAYDDAANTGKLLVKLLADGWKPEAYRDEAAELHK